jgi:hypothetical protein
MFIRSKYGSKRTNGFASSLENSVHELLLIRERSGEIRDIRQQHTVSMTRADIRCKIDFSFIECATEKLIFVEAKGLETDRWRIIKKLWRFYGPSTLEIWKGRAKKPYLDEVIQPIL